MNLSDINLLNGTRPINTPLRIGSVQNRLPNAQSSAVVTTTFIRTFRWPHIIGQDLRTIVLSFCNFYQTGTSAPSNGNVVTVVDCALESSSGRVIPITFSGSPSITLGAGAVDVQSDPIYPSEFSLVKFSRGETWYARGKLSVASGGKFLTTASGNDGGAIQFATYDPSVTTASSTYISGNYTTVSGTAIALVSSGYQPMLLGNPVTDNQSFLAYGDSIGEGEGETVIPAGAGIAGLGMIQRAMHDSGALTNPISCLNICKAGATSAQFTGDAKWQNYIKYAKYAIDEIGHNDLVLSSGTVASVQAACTSLWNTLRSNGILKILRLDLTPATNSNYKFFSFATTPASGGSGYPISSNFNVSLVGGTLASGGFAAQANVTTNSSGVVTSVTAIPAVAGLYANASVPASPASVTGSTGTGLTITLPFATSSGGYYDATNQTAFAFSAAPNSAIDTLNTWFASKVADGTIDGHSSTTVLRDNGTPDVWISDGNNATYTADGTHPSSVSHELWAAVIRASIAANFS